MESLIAELEGWYREHQSDILRDFITFLSFPSISTDEAYVHEIRRTAEWLCSYLKQAGLHVELWETPGHPIVFATHWVGHDKPTVLIYNHYDVQPVDPLELWKSPPFAPVVKNNQIYARGASDNKGQCFYSIQAIRAFLDLAKEKEINIKLFIEGEEESGEKGTMAILEDRREQLQADHLLIIDFGIPAKDTPSVTLGMRGIVTMDVECQNSAIDLHSGCHGGLALNPNRALVSALDKLWDHKGKVAVPGFYDDVKQISKEELSLLDLTFDQEEYVKTFGVRAFANEQGCSLREANWLRPTLELNGIYGGYTGIGFKTVIPAKAGAKISCRLVPDQDPEKIVKSIASFLQEHVAKGIQMKVHMHHGAGAFRTSAHSTVIQEVAKAFEEVFQQKCLYILNGASVPIAEALTQVSGAETALVGVALDSDDFHAPNEHFDLKRFERGLYMLARALQRLSHAKKT